jgi:hypothetical protein
VARPEDVQQLLVRDDGRIEVDLHALAVVTPASRRRCKSKRGRTPVPRVSFNLDLHSIDGVKSSQEQSRSSPDARLAMVKGEHSHAVVGGVFEGASRVAHAGGFHPRDGAEAGLGEPESAHRERRLHSQTTAIRMFERWIQIMEGMRLIVRRMSWNSKLMFYVSGRTGVTLGLCKVYRWKQLSARRHTNTDGTQKELRQTIELQLLYTTI